MTSESLDLAPLLFEISEEDHAQDQGGTRAGRARFSGRREDDRELAVSRPLSRLGDCRNYFICRRNRGERAAVADLRGVGGFIVRHRLVCPCRRHGRVDRRNGQTLVFTPKTLCHHGPTRVDLEARLSADRLNAGRVTSR